MIRYGKISGEIIITLTTKLFVGLKELSALIVPIILAVWWFGVVLFNQIEYFSKKRFRHTYTVWVQTWRLLQKWLVFGTTGVVFQTISGICMIWNRRTSDYLFIRYVQGGRHEEK